MSIINKASQNLRYKNKMINEGRCLDCGRKVITGVRCDVCNIKLYLSGIKSKINRLEKIMIRILEKEEYNQNGKDKI